MVAASGGAAIMAADRAEQFDVPLTQPSDAVRDVLLAHIPEFGSARNPCDVTAQILANPESLNACADALLGDAAYGALVVPQTYGYAPSAKRIPVYNSLAAKHGKITCIAWQSEWLEGPGVKEAEEADMSRCSVPCRRASRPWRRGTGERQSALPTQRHPRRHRPALCSRQAR